MSSRSHNPPIRVRARHAGCRVAIRIVVELREDNHENVGQHDQPKPPIVH